MSIDTKIKDARTGCSEQDFDYFFEHMQHAVSRSEQSINTLTTYVKEQRLA
jgi:hypothetical protein